VRLDVDFPPKNPAKRALHMVLLLACLASCQNTPPPNPAQYHGTLVICLDVSASVGAQMPERLRIAADAIRSLDDAHGWRVLLIPIHADVGRSRTVLWQDTTRVNAFSGDARESRKLLEERHRLAGRCSLAVLSFSGDSTRLTRAQRNGTCLIKGLAYAARALRDGRERAARVRLVVISDFIEDCRDSGLPMERAPVSPDELVRSFRTISGGADFSRVEVAMEQFPVERPSQSLPHLEQAALEDVWRDFMKECAASTLSWNRH